MKQSLLLFTALSLTVYGRTFVGINKVLYVGAQDADLCVDKFVGVPYAQPPVGKLRLQPPQPLKITTGTVDASSPTSAKCYGIENYLLRAGSEDCLTLDIVRPTAKFDHLLPVYVFIHG
jgi:carboxylesterase type B